MKEKLGAEQNVLSKVSELILKKSGNESIKGYAEKETTDFFNYCKLAIRAKSSPLSVEIHRMEALVRMLSGVFWASVIGFFGFVMVILKTPDLIYLILCVAHLIIMWAILGRFRFIRSKEVITVWESFYLVCEEESY